MFDVLKTFKIFSDQFVILPTIYYIIGVAVKNAI